MRVLLAPGADIVAAVRAGSGESIVVEIAPGRDALALEPALAAIGPLAIERAPATRVNAVVVGETAGRDAVDAAIRFLENAFSTTGQVLRIS